LRDFRNELDQAYLKAKDPLPVTLKVWFSPGQEGVEVEAEISFAPLEKIKGRTKKTTAQREFDFDGDGDETKQVYKLGVSHADIHCRQCAII